MRSRILESAVLALALCFGTAQAQGTAPRGPMPGRDQVDRVAQELREHPDLAGTRLDRSLRFKEREVQQQPRPSEDWAALRWIRDFFKWLSETARWLLWVVGAVLVAVLLVRLRGWWSARDGAGAAPSLAPMRVRDLDIRPESLPDDVGAAALALWREGRMREALSLLYRGALSRLVHGHGVPILASSTEGDCLRLASGVLGAQAMGYLDVLVTAWQQAVYADQPPRDEQMTALCATFDARLGRPVPAKPAAVQPA